MKKRFDLSIDHELLEGAKGAFDTCLQIAVRKAIETGSMEGTATVKVHFDIHNGVDSDTGEVYMTPEIQFKAGYSVPMKDGIDGKVIEESRLIQKKGGGFCLVNEQISMDEIMEEEEPEAYRGERQLKEVR